MFRESRWVDDYYAAIFACVARYREMAAEPYGELRCMGCDHREGPHLDSRRHESVPPTACMRGTGDGSVCDCAGFVAPAPRVSTDLLAFLNEFTREAPIVKLSRWLGYVQGVLIERGKTTVQAERDWTRSLFRPLDFTSTTKPVTNESPLAVETRKLLDEWDRGELARGDFEIMLKELIKDA